ncbi:sulfotransferase domain-containing protein [Candidatus Pelagibacter sp.]|nr:sulfotransferase domain-containing protein [Candidatus Pelagibacter sp.]
MIIWLASYPKSGNTLLRSILSSYFYSKDGEFSFNNLSYISQFPLTSQFMSAGINIDNDEEIFKNFINVQNFLNQEKGKVKFLKTHSSLCKMYGSNFTDFNNTLGVIYIVRDPRNVVTSLAHHNDLSIDKAADTMIDNSKFLVKSVKNCRVFLGSWNSNYTSWKNLQIKNRYLLIKYEDLINKKKTTMLKILKFLDQLGMKSQLDIVKLNKAIKSTDFKKVKNLEENETFYEGVLDNKTGKRKTFFNLGPGNDWRRLLDDKIKIKLEKAFEKEMIELGYL